MRSGYLRCIERDSGITVHQIVTFDDTQKCLLCDRPVKQMSTSGTAICGQCDSGTSYKKGIKQRRYEKGTMPSVWCNVRDHWEFPTREEAERKMYDLHLEGIPGWDHVIAKFKGRADDEGI
jgi:hypothetical protein